MKVTLLGTGTSGGVPSLGCHCEVCTSKDPHDRRLRCVAMVETAATKVLIDCGPDIRQQLLPLPFRRIDALLLTHIHYDHVGGIDDLRPYCHFGDIHVYADEATAEGLHHTMPYCFARHLYPGVPRLQLQVLEPRRLFRVGDIDVMPFNVMHGNLPVMAYRFGDFAYITDMKTIRSEDMGYLDGVKVLVVNALRFGKEHYSHQLVPDAVDFARRVGASETYLTHACHEIGLHSRVEQMLPEHIHLAYDGLTLYV
ncbi:MAG: MBL fold metallo-hydrolase [Prevotella sp.]